MNGKRVGYISIAAMFAAFFMYAAFQRGLYFEQDFTPVHVVVDVLGLGVLVFLWVKGEVRAYSGLFALFLMSGVYLLPLLFTRVSVGATLEQIMQWGSYATWLLLVYLFAKRVQYRWLLHGVMGAVGLFIGLGMFAGFYGLFSFQDLYLISHDERFTTLGVRFSGFFQYANTFAVVMGAFLLYHLVHLAKEHRKWAACVIACPLVLFGVAILLSESRGTWLVLLIGWVVGLWVLTSAERRRYVLLSVLLGCAVLLAYQNFVSEFLQKGTHLPGLVMLICATVVYLLLVVGLLYAESRFVIEKKQQLRFSLAGAVIAVLAVTLLLWKSGTLLNRGLHHFESAVAQQLFYRDAWSMFLDSPWIGWGGSAWRMLFHHYQQYPYVGNEVHSGLISVALDVGLVGAIMFCWVFYRFLKPIVVSKSPLIPALLLLLGHSLFDVDMTFGFYWFLLLWLIGTGLAQVEVPLAKKRQPARWRVLWPSHGIVAASLSMLVVCLVCAIHYELGNRSFANKDLAQATKWNPYSIPYRIESAYSLEKAHQEQTALSLLQAGVRFEPQNAQLQWEIGNVYWAMNQPEQMIPYMETAIRLDRFDNAKQENYLQRLHDMAKQQWVKGNKQEAIKLDTHAVVAFEKYEGLDKQLQQLPYRVNDRKFAITPLAKFHAVQSYILIGQYDHAELLLQQLTQVQDPQIQQAALSDLRAVQNIEARLQSGTLQLPFAYDEFLASQS